MVRRSALSAGLAEANFESMKTWAPELMLSLPWRLDYRVNASFHLNAERSEHALEPVLMQGFHNQDFVTPGQASARHQSLPGWDIYDEPERAVYGVPSEGCTFSL